MGFKFVMSSNYDENKPSILFGDFVYRVNSKNLFATRFIMNTAKILSKDFNVFMFSLSSNIKGAQDLIDLYNTINYVFLDDKEITFIRKKEAKNCVEQNKNIARKMIARDLDFIKNVKGVFIRPSVLFKSDMQNELYDTIKSDEESLRIAEEEVKKMNDLIVRGTMYSYTMFMTKSTRIIFDTFEYFINRDKCHVWQFVIDPAHYYKYFNVKHNAKTYYFENDMRGNREFFEFPMGQLNHFYNADKIEVPNFEDKNNLFIWGGVCLFPKGGRMEDWHRLLANFNYERSALHVAKGSAMKVDKNPKVAKKLIENPLYKVTKETIDNHPLNEGILPNKEFEEKLKDYRYTLILKCLSENDSLNFRIYYSLLYNMIPFIDVDYDPENIQIPKKFKDKLVVSNTDEIISKIEYFENNIEEAKKLLSELKQYFMNEKYFNESYYENEFKKNYFKELYQ